MTVRILKHYVHLPVVLLILLEASVAVAAFGVVMLGQFTAPAGGQPAWPAALYFAVAVVLASAAMGLYNGRLRVRPRGLGLRFSAAAACVFVFMVSLTGMLPGLRVSPSQVALALAAAVVLNLLIRFVMSRFLREGMLKAQVLVYGAGQQAQNIMSLRRRADRIGFNIVGYVPVASDVENMAGLKTVDSGGDLLECCRAHDVDEIVVAMDDRRQEFPLRDLLHCRINGIGVVELADFLERETGAVRLDVTSPGWMIFSDGFQRSNLRDLVGRFLDVAASLALLMVTWPLMLLVVLAIKLEDGWRTPVIYRQARVGKDGEVFDVLKFRSMALDAEADGVARWAEEEDGRVTRVGAVIRLLRLDELPQLLNVLKGDMRFVGPRPERPAFVTQLAETIPYYHVRHSVAPGLTGWAQLCYPYGSSQQDAVEKLQYDLYYIKNRNLLFDLAIVVQTVEVVLFGKGAR